MPKEKKPTGRRKKAEKRQKDASVARSDSPKRSRASPSDHEALISTPGNNTFGSSEVSAAPGDDNTPLIDTDSLAKHPSILRKFQALLRSKPATLSANDAQVPEPVILPDELQPQGLQPLPQPLSTKRTKSQIPLDSTLPPWLSQPTVVSPDYSILFTDLPLSTKLQNRIASHLKFERAFAVQAAVLPLLLAGPMDQNYHTYYDVLVSAPTGSGKTLSYVLPVIQNLSQRTITRLRAVIIVPTRELVSQVRDTMDSLASGLKVGIAWGARSLDFERTLLVKDHWEADIGRPDIFDDQYGDDVRYSSKVDVLICTPGRLVEHLKTTPGFNFKDLKWMIIDEADRLLAQSFQEWLGAVSKSLHLESSQFDTKTHEFINTLGMRKNEYEGVRKIILSATMTKDAGKLAGLKLRRPKLVVIEHEAVEKTSNEDKKLADVPMIDQQEETDEDDKPDEIFSVPSTLSEHYIAVGDIEDKPLYLVQLLQLQGIRSGVLVFTKSNESAARLARLMDLMVEGLKVGLVSGELNKAGRKRTLAEFKRNKIDILVCSDLISRGMDLPAVDHVVNYDSSSSTSSYVHRVGRTARAGNEGDAWSLVATNEARWFWRNVGRGIKRAGKTIERVSIDFAVDRAARERHQLNNKVYQKFTLPSEIAVRPTTKPKRDSPAPTTQQPKLKSLPNMSDSGEVENTAAYAALPKDVTEQIGQGNKLFNKWTYDDIEIRDISLTDYIQINKPVYLPHSAGRYAVKRFRKAQCPIVERLTNSLMMNGRNNGKKLMAVRIVDHAFTIINITTDQNPIQITVDAIVNCGPREDSTRIGSAGTVRRQAVDVSPLRRVNQAIALLTIGAREASFRNVKSIAECLAEELINAAKGSSNSYAIKKKDELERVAKSNR